VTEVSYTKGDIGIGFRDEIKEKGTLIAGAVCGYGATTSKPTTTLKKEIEKPGEEEKEVFHWENMK